MKDRETNRVNAEVVEFTDKATLQAFVLNDCSLLKCPGQLLGGRGFLV